MSPAHPSALLTPLDAFIWLKVDARMDPQRKYRMHTEARQADRRDAEVMLQLTHYDHWERDYTRDRVHSVATAFRLVWRQI